ncbi:hypothetical protein yrohd0001_27450 [Yersinia rohdei ATCC 43380]|nr:hypothetical protein yrohd0001_27450 [Yersinia rohdei ATCC 43380]
MFVLARQDVFSLWFISNTNAIDYAKVCNEHKIFFPICGKII